MEYVVDDFGPLKVRFSFRYPLFGKGYDKIKIS
jgi:hypothetical protein